MTTEPKKYGWLTKVKDIGRNKHGSVIWLLKCDCGNLTKSTAQELNAGKKTSCGCMRGKHNSHPDSHGESHKTKENKAWFNMKSRCNNPKHSAYSNYGGRGIKVCDKWQNDYVAFLADVGRAPGPDYSLDRINVNGNYEPGNVRWATATEQNNNKRISKANRDLYACSCSNCPGRNR